MGDLIRVMWVVRFVRVQPMRRCGRVMGFVGYSSCKPSTLVSKSYSQSFTRHENSALNYQCNGCQHTIFTVTRLKFNICESEEETVLRMYIYIL